VTSLTVLNVRMQLEELLDRCLTSTESRRTIKEALRLSVASKNKKPRIEEEIYTIKTCEPTDPEIDTPCEKNVCMDLKQTDTRIDPSIGIPLIIPKGLCTSSFTPVLAELSRNESKRVDISGDSGAIGKVTMLDRIGCPIEQTDTKKNKSNEKYLDSTIRIDIKSEVFHGKMLATNATFIAVSVNKEAKVQAVFNTFLRATFQSEDLTFQKEEQEEQEENSDGEEELPKKSAKRRKKL